MDAQPQLKATRKRSRRERLLYAGLTLFIAVLALDGVFGAHGLIATYRLKLQARQEQRKIQQLQQENGEFSQQVRELKSDPSAIEHVAHERMGLVKPGVLVFKLPPGASSTTPPSQPAPTHR